MAGPARATPSSDELVRQARAHEAAHEDDVAVRRYMEALDADATAEDAWLGLGALRMRLGEAAEAERVYDAALQRVPLLRRAVAGRAHALWAQGKHVQA
ncbi:MAG TPA: tetratricopeptide repeat protein, partial [Polyangiaceae bacterium]|nr:tetratricopeptide repeat protein [Polyangiaceae bacterium]